jgi:hypothetical protein
MATGLGLHKTERVTNVLSFAAFLRTSLVMAVGAIIFLPGRDGD